MDYTPKMAYNFGVWSENGMKQMFPRLLQLLKKQSLFLFGPRNTGKSTLLSQQYSKETSHVLDLLDVELEERLAKNPNMLIDIVQALPEKIDTVILDEVQKVPKLLDVVHHLIESTNKHFIMSGSSARRLKRGGANLLAGRAFVYYLHPLSVLELAENFDLSCALQWGLLPSVWLTEDSEVRKQFLQAYTRTYLKEEVWEEQFIRKLDPFRRFLEVSAQCNGKIINFSNIARDVGVDDKTVKEYYALLEDTMLGFFLEGFQNSFRKRLSTKPKFYYFDVGVARALARHLSLPLRPSTNAYGETFEHFLILECIKLASYYRNEYRFSYLRTKDDREVDLVVDRPGQATLLIEIKSTTNVQKEALGPLIKLSEDLGDCEAVCFSQDTLAKKIEHVMVYPWQQGLEKFFGQEGGA